jgi:TatD DNase family protein
MLIDTHCHIQFKPLVSNVDEVIERAKKEDVKKLIVVGCDIKSSKEAIKLAEKHDNIFAAVGLHPQDSKKLTDEMWEDITKLAQHEKVVAIGETGLDYFKEYSPKETQIRVFKKHIKLALEVDKPLIVHNRDADEASFHILQELGAKKVVFHCFSSDVPFARRVWAAGYMTSFTGNVTYPKAQNLRDVIEECPLDSIMVETDCPYLAPQKYRGGTNEPSYVVEIAKQIADTKGKQFSEIAGITTKNAEGFFGI